MNKKISILLLLFCLSVGPVFAEETEVSSAEVSNEMDESFGEEFENEINQIKEELSSIDMEEVISGIKEQKIQVEKVEEIDNLTMPEKVKEIGKTIWLSTKEMMLGIWDNSSTNIIVLIALVVILKMYQKKKRKDSDFEDDFQIK